MSHPLLNSVRLRGTRRISATPLTTRAFWGGASDDSGSGAVASNTNGEAGGEDGAFSLAGLPRNVASAGLAVFGGAGLRAALSESALSHWFHAGDPTALDIDSEAVAELAAGRLRDSAVALEEQLLREPHNLFALRLAQGLQALVHEPTAGPTPA